MGLDANFLKRPDQAGVDGFQFETYPQTLADKYKVYLWLFIAVCIAVRSSNWERACPICGQTLWSKTEMEGEPVPAGQAHAISEHCRQ